METSACAFALKEWAVISRALVTGRQTLLLRKGGLIETFGEFQPEQQRFWLYPTQFHQGREKLAPEFADLATEVEAPPSGEVVLSALGEITAVSHLSRLEQALAFRGLHGWSDEVIEQRFHYRQPGLHLSIVRVYRCEHSHRVTESDAMAGCKSWVELPAAFETGSLTPVLTDEQWESACREISARMATA
jgi:hypothetical protein